MAADAASDAEQRTPRPGDTSALPATPPPTTTPQVPRTVETTEVVMTHEIRKPPKRPRGTGNLRMINQFEFVSRVGKGQHGDVWLARDTSDGGKEVPCVGALQAIKAVKRKNPKVDRMSKLRKRNLPTSQHMRLTDQLGSTEQKIKKEIAIMKKCKHPHVVRLLEVIDDQLHERIYMVMEYLGGGEIKWRNSRDEPTLRVDQTRRICRDVILGLEYLHHQGIIHRDIKPANLLWSSDRRTVKITDFGVSHLSVAQLLARHGKGGAPLDEMDAILMDDSDLSKTAGTPLFLAPEIVADTPFDDAGNNSAAIPVRKQPITKAIDVWAFGVTLYGLLFGVLPFMSTTEYDIYRIIRHQDWEPLETMGSDKIPSGKRYPPPHAKGDQSEGALAIDLLQRLLEKDAKKRITLYHVKRHPWIVKDLDDPQAWWRETELDNEESVNVTPAETRSAVSSVRFRWGFGRVAPIVSSFVRKVRPTRSFRQRHRPFTDGDKTKDVGVQSVPNETRSVSRRQSAGAALQHTRHTREALPDKGKQPQIHAQNIDITARPPSEDIDLYKIWDKDTTATPKPRRGSLPYQTKRPDMTLLVPGLAQRTGSALTSPRSLSQASSPGEPSGAQSPHERPRSRNSLQAFMRNFLPGRHPPPAPLEASPSASEPLSEQASSPTSAATSLGRRAGALLGRRSADAFNSHAGSRQSSGSGPLTLAMRAASWGEMADYVHVRPSEDLTSLYSGERPDEGLDEETYLVGAGGVAHSPVPSLPSGLSTVSSTASLPPPMAVAHSVAHAILQRNEAAEHAPLVEAAAHSASAYVQSGHARARTTSPLVHMSFHSRRLEGEVSYDDEDESDDDESMFGDTRSESSDADAELRPSMSQLYQEEDDDEESDDENFRLEVRTRRPSASAGELSPPRRSVSRHGDRAAICI